MREGKHSCRKWSLALLALTAMVALSVPAMAAPEANTCNGTSELSYPTAPNFVADRRQRSRRADARRGEHHEGRTSSRSIRVSSIWTARRRNLGINCLDDGPLFPTRAVSRHLPAFHGLPRAGDTLPNQVVFTPAADRDPGEHPNFCSSSST
jgi:hypothetical protein